MGNYGIKIAKEGNDITSTTPSDYHFWSKYRNKSIKAVGSIDVTTTTDVDSAAVVGSFQHDFGYIPQFMVFVVNDFNGAYVNCDYDYTTTIGKDGDYATETLTAYATSTHIYVTANKYQFVPMSGTWTGLANTYTFDYVLFMEEVETS
jgi:hypothetical protein